MSDDANLALLEKLQAHIKTVFNEKACQEMTALFGFYARADFTDKEKCFSNYTSRLLGNYLSISDPTYHGGETNLKVCAGIDLLLDQVKDTKTRGALFETMFSSFASNDISGYSTEAGVDLRASYAAQLLETTPGLDQHVKLPWHHHGGISLGGRIVGTLQKRNSLDTVQAQNPVALQHVVQGALINGGAFTERMLAYQTVGALAIPDMNQDIQRKFENVAGNNKKCAGLNWERKSKTIDQSDTPVADTRTLFEAGLTLPDTMTKQLAVRAHTELWGEKDRRSGALDLLTDVQKKQPVVERTEEVILTTLSDLSNIDQATPKDERHSRIERTLTLIKETLPKLSNPQVSEHYTHTSLGKEDWKLVMGFADDKDFNNNTGTFLFNLATSPAPVQYKNPAHGQTGSRQAAGRAHFRNELPRFYAVAKKDTRAHVKQLGANDIYLHPETAPETDNLIKACCGAYEDQFGSVRNLFISIGSACTTQPHKEAMEKVGDMTDEQRFVAGHPELFPKGYSFGL